MKTAMRLAFEEAANKAEWGPLRRLVKKVLRRSTGIKGRRRVK